MPAPLSSPSERDFPVTGAPPLKDEETLPSVPVVPAAHVSGRSTAAEEALLQRDRYLAALVEVQRELLRHPTVRPALDRVLALLGGASGASRVYLFTFQPDPAGGTPFLHEETFWRAPGVPLPGDLNTKKVHLNDLTPTWTDTLARGEAVQAVASQLEGVERALLDLCGSRVILLAPILVHGRLHGSLGFAHTDEERLWEPAATSHLLLAASTLALALEREGGAVALAAETRRLGVTLQDISERDRYLAALVAAQRELLNEPDVADGALERFLARLGQAADADRVYFYDQLRDELTGEIFLRQRGEWCAPGLPPGLGGEAVHRLPLHHLGPLWMAELAAGQVIIGAVDENTPPAERALLESRRVRSGLVLPVLVHGEFAGGLGFDNCQSPRPRWNEAEIDHLRAAAAALALALERERSARALAAETRRLTVTLAALTEGVITTDADGRVVLLNRAAEALTGRPVAGSIGRPLREVFRTFEAPEGGAPRAADTTNAAVPGGLPLAEGSHRVWLEGADGQRRLIDKVSIPVPNADGRPTGVVRVFRDVTNEERLAAEMLKASKLDSLGILAGGIAHDFNNILTAILGNISLARRDPAGRSADEKLDQAERACVRARDLTGQLLTFARGGAPLKKLARLPEIIRESVGFALHGSSARVHFDVPADLWPVEADTGQLSQVLNNLAINGMQAMSRDGGILGVRAENLVLAGDDPLGLPRGRYVKIAVEDNGCGIPNGELEKIFDPFFTTKPGGTGLGLATSYSIAKRHGGLLNVDSVPGVGSIFRLFLPAAEDGGKAEVGIGKEPALSGSSTSALSPSDLSPTPVHLPTSAIKVLVLDDEPAVRTLLVDMLGHLGAEVTVAETGAGAVTMCRRARADEQPFDLLILDLTVPGGMGGLEVLSTLRAEDPGVRAIVSSGYAHDPIVSRHAEHGFAGVLSKPYRLADLAAALEASRG